MKIPTSSGQNPKNFFKAECVASDLNAYYGEVPSFSNIPLEDAVYFLSITLSSKPQPSIGDVLEDIYTTTNFSCRGFVYLKSDGSTMWFCVDGNAANNGTGKCSYNNGILTMPSTEAQPANYYKYLWKVG